MRCRLMMLAAVLMPWMAVAALAAEASLLRVARQPLGADAVVSKVATAGNLSVYSRLGGGFAIVTDVAPSPRLVAYSRTAALDLDDGNPGLRWWMAMMRRVSARRAAPTPPDTTRYASRVDSLITTLWGQGAPFNAWCPTADGAICADYSPDVEHCDVGCVATAVAQIVRYYRYPARAAGECDFAIGDQPAHDAFSAAYDWVNMPDYCRDGYTEAQGRAVAQLSYHCGLISRMNYGTNASGSSNQNAINGLVRYFGYSDRLHYVVRTDYTEQQWMEMIYDELTHRRPILYTGVEVNFAKGIVGGHSFIVDGYDENGLVHVNWGWEGRANGYYDVAMLNPLYFELNDYQDMVLGFEPDHPAVGGDVTGDGEVDIADVNAVINVMLGKAATVGGDVTGDGVIDVADINAIINIMLGK